MEAIGEDWTIDLTTTRPASELMSGYSFFEDGDIAIAKVTPCFENGKGAILRGLTGGTGFGTTELTVVRPSPNVDTRYLFYVLNEDRFKQLGTAEMTGAGGLKRVPDRIVRDFVIDLPNLTEQVAIADFLDRETAEIDAFIVDQEELIALLTERRAATITHAVTRGLDPSAPMKETGVEWLRAVPSEWRVQPLWSLFARVKDVGHPDEPMLSVFRQYGVVLKENFENINKTADNRNIYQLIEPGWLATNRMKAWQGSVGVSSYRGIVSGHYICFAPRHQESPRFLNYLFRSTIYTAGYLTLSRGVRIGQAEIDNDQYRLLPVILPSRAEQTSIADYLDHETAELDAAIADAREAIALSKERRAALISAAVTGKIDVRSAS